jgi:hypothetical protein
MDLRLLALVCLFPACVVDDGPSTTLEPTPSSSSTATPTTSAGESTSSGADTNSSTTTTTAGAAPAYGEPYSDCTATNDCPDPLVCDVREVITADGPKTIHQCLAPCDPTGDDWGVSECPPAPGDQPVTCTGYCYLDCELEDPNAPACPAGMACNNYGFCA